MQQASVLHLGILEETRTEKKESNLPWAFLTIKPMHGAEREWVDGGERKVQF